MDNKPALGIVTFPSTKREKPFELTAAQAASLMAVDYERDLRFKTWSMEEALAIMNGYSTYPPSELILGLAKKHRQEARHTQLSKMEIHLRDDFHDKRYADSEVMLNVRRKPIEWIRWAIDCGYELPNPLVQYADEFVKPIEKEPAKPIDDTLIRLPEVLEMTSMNRNAVYATEGFPKPVKLTTRSAAWVKREVQDWIQQRIRSRDGQ